MKLEWKITLGAATFLIAVFFIYWFTSYEDAGSTMLVFGSAAYTLIFLFILLQWLRRRRLPRAEDRDDGSPTDADASGEISFFPAASIWPVGMGIGAVFLAVGLVYGTWYWAIGGIIFVGAIIGFSVEAEAK